MSYDLARQLVNDLEQAEQAFKAAIEAPDADAAAAARDYGFSTLKHARDAAHLLVCKEREKRRNYDIAFVAQETLKC